MKTENTPTATLSQRSIAQALGMSVGLTNAILTRFPGKKRLGFPVVSVGEGSGEVERERSAGCVRVPRYAANVCVPHFVPVRKRGTRTMSVPSESGLRPDRWGVGSPPAQSGTVYLLSELYPELASQAGSAAEAATPLPRIVLGKR
jgi:hypothetical protein